MRSRSIALLLSGPGLLLLSAARLLIISNYNSTTAVTVASSGGFVNTLLGTVIPLVPVFLPWIALCLVLSKHFLLSIIAFAAAGALSPTSLALSMTKQLIRLDARHIGLYITSDRSLALMSAIVIAGFASWAYHRNWIEILGTLMALAVAAVAVSIPATTDAAFTSQVRSARAGEHHLLKRVGGVERAVTWARRVITDTGVNRWFGHGEIMWNIHISSTCVPCRSDYQQIAKPVRHRDRGRCRLGPVPVRVDLVYIPEESPKTTSRPGMSASPPWPTNHPRTHRSYASSITRFYHPPVRLPSCPPS
jgi:hypothetical protein